MKKKSTSALILFTLPPEAEGRRKPLGLGRPERAAEVFAAFLEHLESLCSDLPDVDLFVTVPGTQARYLPQRGSSFGESLRFAVEDAFSFGYQRVAVIGNDAPEISPSYVQSAFRRLRTGRSAVIGPAPDGGYALLGLTSPCPRAFESMPWGSSIVARLTQERLSASGFTVERLAAVEDIDGRRDLARFFARARRGHLADMARRVATVPSRSFPRFRSQVLSLSEILFAGWRGLRAPPTAARLD